MGKISALSAGPDAVSDEKGKHGNTPSISCSMSLVRFHSSSLFGVVGRCTLGVGHGDGGGTRLKVFTGTRDIGGGGAGVVVVVLVVVVLVVVVVVVLIVVGADGVDHGVGLVRFQSMDEDGCVSWAVADGGASEVAGVYG